MANEMQIGPGLLEECLPSLELLNDMGIEYLDLLFEFFADGNYRTAVIFPRFFDYDLPPLPDSRANIESAYEHVSAIVSKALRNATQACRDDGQLRGFIALVRFECCFHNEEGWTVRGEVTATDADKSIEMSLMCCSAEDATHDRLARERVRDAP